MGTNVISWITRLFAALLRLYPCAFRAEFEPEMRAVFGAAAVDAARRGRRSLIALCWRELRDLPQALLREHWLCARYKVKERLMQPSPSVNSANNLWGEPGGDGAPGSWGEAALAALPHALVGLVLSVPGILRTWDLLPIYNQERASILDLSLPILLVGTLIVLLVLAWRRRWPRWSASLYGYGLLAGLVALALALKAIMAPGERLVITSTVWYSVFFVLLAGMLFGVAQRDRLRALLVALPVIAMLWMPMLEFVPLRIDAPLQLGAWLGTALVAAAVVRLGDARGGMWLPVAINLVIGIVYAYARTYYPQFPPDMPRGLIRDPTLAAMIHRFAPAFLSLSTLAIGPLLVRALLALGKRGGRVGKVGSGLAVAGLLLELAGNMGADWLISSDSLQAYWLRGFRAFSIVAAAGVGAYALGVAILGLAAWRKRALPGVVPCVLLAMLPLLLPLVSMLPLLYGLRSVHVGWPLGLHRLNAVPKGQVYAAGAAWLLLAGWLVTGKGQRGRPQADGELPGQAA
jgi:hypothetical protein